MSSIPRQVAAVNTAATQQRTVPVVEWADVRDGLVIAPDECLIRVDDDTYFLLYTEPGEPFDLEAIARRARKRLAKHEKEMRREQYRKEAQERWENQTPEQWAELEAKHWPSD